MSRRSAHESLKSRVASLTLEFLDEDYDSDEDQPGVVRVRGVQEALGQTMSGREVAVHFRRLQWVLSAYNAQLIVRAELLSAFRRWKAGLVSFAPEDLPRSVFEIEDGREFLFGGEVVKYSAMRDLFGDAQGKYHPIVPTLLKNPDGSVAFPGLR